jgi:hypothetical protein
MSANFLQTVHQLLRDNPAVKTPDDLAKLLSDKARQDPTFAQQYKDHAATVQAPPPAPTAEQTQQARIQDLMTRHGLSEGMAKFAAELKIPGDSRAATASNMPESFLRFANETEQQLRDGLSQGQRMFASGVKMP